MPRSTASAYSPTATAQLRKLFLGDVYRHNQRPDGRERLFTQLQALLREGANPYTVIDRVPLLKRLLTLFSVPVEIEDTLLALHLRDKGWLLAHALDARLYRLSRQLLEQRIDWRYQGDSTSGWSVFETSVPHLAMKLRVTQEHRDFWQALTHHPYAKQGLRQRNDQQQTLLHVLHVDDLIRAGEPEGYTVAGWVDECLHWAPLEAKDREGNTALVTSCKNSDHVSKVVALLAQGARVNAINRAGETALHYAAANMYSPGLLALLKAGANPVHRCKQGNTPLHALLIRLWGRVGFTQVDYLEKIRWLLEAGAQGTDTNSAGVTPLALAQAMGAAEVYALLAEHQARGAAMDLSAQLQQFCPLAQDRPRL